MHVDIPVELRSVRGDDGSMNRSQKFTLTLLRISIGWMFFYAGITKVLDPAWSAAGYLKAAKQFPEFYQWLASPAMLPITNALNEWGLTLVGVALVLGVGVRLAGALGAVIMILYYLPLGVPYPNSHALVVDEHIIYAATLLFLAAVRAGRVWGLERWCAELPFCRSIPGFRALIG
jgi:thiosulfate dehydrogenase (quinone) large subunit